MTTIRRAAVVLAAVLAAALVGIATSEAATRADVTITSADGTRLAATIVLPDGVPPAGGWPGVILMHGLGGDRSSMLAVAEQMGLVGRYAVLAYDARGHGQSGGLIGIDGPKELADTQSVFAWFRDRPDVADAKIGGWGASYGGGAALNSLAAGTPWAAVQANITWTDLRTALMPQNLLKSGVAVGFISSLPPDKVDPEVRSVLAAAYAGDVATVAAWGAQRSSTPRLAGIATPVMILHGRRDFAFGVDQALLMWRQLAGPKRLWLGLHGHAPSSFPAADSAAMLRESLAFFAVHLGTGSGGPAPALEVPTVAIAPESWTGAPVRFGALPRTRTTTYALPGRRTIAQPTKAERRLAPLRQPLEVFGSPVVKVKATAARGWSRLVAVLSARTPAGQEIVVGGGGVPTKPGTRTYAIALSSQVTFLPKGSRLTVTLASSSLQQNPGNLLYLDLPMPASARLTVGPATLTLPALVKPVSR